MSACLQLFILALQTIGSRAAPTVLSVTIVTKGIYASKAFGCVHKITAQNQAIQLIKSVYNTMALLYLIVVSLLLWTSNLYFFGQVEPWKMRVFERFGDKREVTGNKKQVHG